jgi:2-iminobutanoate/2-iminopropanoate deaminase
MWKTKALFAVYSICTVTACAPHIKSALIERKHYESYEKDIGYAQVVRVGNRLYVSGVVNSAPTFKAQLQENYKTIKKILADFGVDSRAIVKETIYTRDIEALKAAIPERKAFYPADLYPAATWVQVSQLFDITQLIEIEVEAHLP